MRHISGNNDTTPGGLATPCYFCGTRVVEAEAACSDCITDLAVELRQRHGRRHGRRGPVRAFGSAPRFGATGGIALAL